MPKRQKRKLNGIKRTITLSNHPPVTIVAGDWDFLSSASIQTYDGTWFLGIRQHHDGRAIVYGVGKTQFDSQRAGYLLGPDEDIVETLYDVAQELAEMPSDDANYDPQVWWALYAKCLNKLPSVEI